VRDANLTPISIQVVQLSHAKGLPLPAYASIGSAGVDLCAAIDEDIVLYSGKTLTIPTGLQIALPDGFEAQVRPRSGLALKNSIGVLNSPGTIDSDYRGEIKVILINFGPEPLIIHRGDRIAQMVVARYEKIEWRPTVELNATARGEGGFGHTGQ